MTLLYYVWNFVFSLSFGYLIVKYVFKSEPNFGLVIGSILGELIYMAIFGIK